MTSRRRIKRFPRARVVRAPPRAVRVEGHLLDALDTEFGGYFEKMPVTRHVTSDERTCEWANKQSNGDGVEEIDGETDGRDGRE